MLSNFHHISRDCRNRILRSPKRQSYASPIKVDMCVGPQGVPIMLRRCYHTTKPICHQFSVHTAWEKNRMRLSLWIIIALAYISAPLIPPSLPISGRSQGVLRHDANSDMALIITPFAKCCNLCRFSIVVLHTEIRQRPVITSKNSPPPVEYILNEEYLKLSDGSQRRRDRPVWCRRIYGYFASWLWGVRRRKETGDAKS